MTKLHLAPSGAGRAELRGQWQALVRGLAAERCGAPPETLRIEADAQGKPFLTDCPGFHFSVSHSKGLLVVAESDQPVGVDAELLRPVRPAIADRFFTPFERDCVLAAPEEQEQRLFTVWTRKEAYLKYTGTGIRVPLDSFDVLDGSLPVRIDSFVWEGYVISCCRGE